jgi:proline dehydrogenase
MVSDSANLTRGLLFSIAKRWIAGETYQEAMQRAERSSANKLFGIINLLGEETTAREEAAAATAEYLTVLKAIDAAKIRCCISVKPTQLGLTIERKLYEENMKTILATAKSFSNFVWVDMEGSQYTADTVDSYLEFWKHFDNVGVAIQAYLKRSEEDVNRILDSKGVIRLVKGAYKESSSIAFKRKGEISENFSKLMGTIFERGGGFAVATHDEKLIEEAAELSKTHPTGFEFEMLMGIRDAKKVELAGRGFRASEYIPYGKGWWGYSVRRMREHKSNIFLLGRSLLGV